MEVKENIMAITVMYSKDKSSRYLLTKQRDKSLPKQQLLC